MEDITILKRWLRSCHHVDFSGGIINYFLVGADQRDKGPDILTKHGEFSAEEVKVLLSVVRLRISKWARIRIHSAVDTLSVYIPPKDDKNVC